MSNTLFCNCEGGLVLNRRTFLKASAILSFAALPALSLAGSQSDTRLLTILLRGGLDGLQAMPPVGDRQLEALRPTINPDDALKLDKFFALHPAFRTVHELYQKGEAVLVHATSIPYTLRSHFEGQNVMQSGVMKPYASDTGWLGRALDVIGYDSIAMSLPMPLILRGKARPENVYPSWLRPVPDKVYAEILPLWVEDSGLAVYGKQVQAEMDEIGAFENLSAPVQMGDQQSLADLARDAARRLARPDGPRMAVLDHVGFDTHANEEQQGGRHFAEVDDAIRAFRDEIGDDVWKRTLVVTVTEFGRTAKENSSQGTDHGYGTAVFLLGGKLRKGGIIADWPGLKQKNMFEGRDLLATIDARAIYGALMSNVLDIDPDRVQREVLDYESKGLLDKYL